MKEDKENADDIFAGGEKNVIFALDCFYMSITFPFSRDKGKAKRERKNARKLMGKSGGHLSFYLKNRGVV